MLNAFCEACAKKPGWDFKVEYVVQRSCMRCMLHRPCNFYVDKKPVHESVAMEKHHAEAAPKPKDLVKEQVNPHAECKLPPATGYGMPTPPAAPAPSAPAEQAEPAVPAQGAVVAQSEAAVKEEAAKAPEPAPGTPATKPQTDADKMLEALQPNRPGVRLETVKKTR